MATYEGKWRCVRCSMVNLGRNLNCQTCGVKRADDVRFFLDDDTPELTDANLLDQANAGANWICRYCSGGNPATNSRCSSCGSVRSDGDRQLQEETRGAGDWSEAAQAQYAADGLRQIVESNQKPSRLWRWFKFGLLGAGACFAFLIAVFAFFLYIGTREYPVEVEVSGLEWERVVKIEEYKTVTETAWEGEVPPAARVQSNERAVHHLDKVPDGTRTVEETYTERVSDGSESYVCGKINKKNGYFEDKYCSRTKYKNVTKTRSKEVTNYRDVPVYKTRYTYLIEKWVPGERVTSGADFNPQWANVQTDGVKTRETGRTESYNLICKELGGENKLHKMKLAPEDLPKIQNGAYLKGKLDFGSRLIALDDFPKAERVK